VRPWRPQRELDRARLSTASLLNRSDFIDVIEPPSFASDHLEMRRPSYLPNLDLSASQLCARWPPEREFMLSLPAAHLPVGPLDASARG
jgi:hypothetical protein